MLGVSQLVWVGTEVAKVSAGGRLVKVAFEVTLNKVNAVPVVDAVPAKVKDLWHVHHGPIRRPCPTIYLRDESYIYLLVRVVLKVLVLKPIAHGEVVRIRIRSGRGKVCIMVSGEVVKGKSNFTHSARRILHIKNGHVIVIAIPPRSRRGGRGARRSIGRRCRWRTSWGSSGG